MVCFSFLRTVLLEIEVVFYINLISNRIALKVHTIYIMKKQ